ncbi:MAG: VpsF family polysaccharide biosynthesis protein [Hyphomicrobiaceae bacterium]|nr:VpsF family polysaccharide biosynthesis protein [Hyphomicrobiaceae bacterium]
MPIRTSPPGPLFGFGLGVLAIVLLTISPLALVELGLNYDETGGTPLEKIHPATVLASFLVLLAAVSAGNPITWLEQQVVRHRSLLPYLIVIGLLIVHSLRVVKLPFTPFFDTAILPLLVFLLYKDMPEGRGRHLAYLVHGLMFANALLGLGEFASGVRLTPLVAAGVVIEDDWRSTALLGHPLSNASLTGCYLLAMALGGGRDLPWSARLAAFVVNAGGMIVFGGRAATVLMLLIMLALVGLHVARILAGRRFSSVSVLKILMLAPVAGIAIAVLAETGFFDQFLMRFIDDKGSAEARTEMFQLFNHVPWSELILGPDARQIETLRHYYGLDFGIESFWIAYILSYGLIASIAFFAALLAFTRDVIISLRPGAAWAFLFFYGVASTSVSLSAKSPLLGIFTFMMLVLMRRPAQPAATAPSMAAQRLQPRQRLAGLQNG